MNMSSSSVYMWRLIQYWQVVGAYQLRNEIFLMINICEMSQHTSY